MPRAIWTGSITFGLVSIPVGLYTATEDHTIHFHQFQRGTSDRIRNQRVNERTGDEVDYDDIVRGAEVGDGEYVIVEPAELDAVAPGRSRNLEITDFVDLDEIDPIWFQRTYWLAPSAEEYTRPYTLLLQAMQETGRAAIGSFVMRNKEYLAAIRPDDDVLALETLFFADEVRDPQEHLDLPAPRKGRADDRELAMATRLIDSMSGPWKPENYRDTYRDRVARLIEEKRKGETIVQEAEPPDPTEMSDLLAALERSVDAARKGGHGRTAKEGSRSRKADTTSEQVRDADSKKAHDDGAPKKARDDAGSKKTRRDSLRDATKTELQRRARELDVPGRSKMSRDELADAVVEAERASGSRRKAS